MTHFLIIIINTNQKYNLLSWVSLAIRNYLLLPLWKDEFSFLQFGKFTQYWQNIFPFGFIVNYKPHKILFQAGLKSLSFFAFFTLVGWESPVLAFSSSSLPLLKLRNKVPAQEAAIFMIAAESTDSGLRAEPGSFPHCFQNGDCNAEIILILRADLTNVTPRSTG